MHDIDKIDLDVMNMSSESIKNNALPNIPSEYNNGFFVFHVIDEKIITNHNELDYGLISNITPLWWSELVLYENTGDEKYLKTAKKYIDKKLAVVFYPELLLNPNQQKNIENILRHLDYDGNILLKTNSPFIIQTCKANYVPKHMVYLGSFKKIII